MIKNKRIIVFGGGGSIGTELVRQLVPFNKVFIFDIDETRTFDLYEELNLKGHKVDYRVGDIRNKESVAGTINYWNPHIIINAAAYKHVTPMQRFPLEAVHTNIVGTWNIAQYVQKRKLVFISTDKVVNSESVMGMTKKIGEVLTKQYGGMIVRFGNVMGSRGSVIPLWQASIDRGEPLNVTDARMTRYMMTIPEAVSLVIEAAEKGKTGETWIMDMGKPVNILELAKKIIKESGKDVGIKMIGIRPGEALEEKLMTSEEEKRAIHKGNFWILK